MLALYSTSTFDSATRSFEALKRPDRSAQVVALTAIYHESNMHVPAAFQRIHMGHWRSELNSSCFDVSGVGTAPSDGVRWTWSNPLLENKRIVRPSRCVVRDVEVIIYVRSYLFSKQISQTSPANHTFTQGSTFLYHQQVSHHTQRTTSTHQTDARNGLSTLRQQAPPPPQPLQVSSSHLR